MRTLLSASQRRPLTYIASLSAYSALITFMITFFTTSNLVAGIAGALTVALLVGSYLLERWARRRTVYASDPLSSPATGPTTDGDGLTHKALPLEVEI
jgi:hypothetical protein